MTSAAAKIFRPWTAENEKKQQSAARLRQRARSDTILNRVPEPGYPATDFLATYGDHFWHDVAGAAAAAAALEVEWPAPATNAFAYPAAAGALTHPQQMSYLDPAYLSMAFGDLSETLKQSNKLKQRPKKFRCPHCKVSFSNNGQLKGHVRIHTGERPFKCDAEKCGKSFTRNEELTRHKRIHTGLRPFACDQCGKRFGRKDHLKKHIRTHYPQARYIDSSLFALYPTLLFGY